MIELPKKTLIVPIGIPGSGKSTLLNRVSVDWPGFRFGADDIRELVFGDVSTQGNPGLVHEAARAALKIRLATELPACYDATNINRKSRAPLFGLAKAYGYDVVALVSTVPYDVAEERNKNRTVGKVPEFVLDRMIANFEAASLEEGFKSIRYFGTDTSELDFTFARD